jgi:hypothetical protein
VRFDDGGFFVGRSFFLCFPEFLDEGHRSAFETALETSSGTGVNELTDWQLVGFFFSFY